MTASSEIQGAVPTAPASPTISAPLATMASLSWTASNGASSYNVYRSTTAGGETLDKSGITGTFFEDTGLSDGTVYFYKVTAVNSSGESVKSKEVSVTSLPPTPSTFSATAGDSQVALQWSASKSATAYRVYRDTVGGAGGAASFVVKATNYTDTGLLNGTPYYYFVVPINASGENHSAGIKGAATPVALNRNEAPAGAPTGLRAMAGNARTILNWSPVSNASTYDVFRATTAGSETLLQSGVTALTFTDSGLTNGATYFYKVRASNGSLSTEVNATPNIPAAPSKITPTASSNLVMLTWLATGTSYAIYRGTTSGGETLLDSGLTGNTYTDAAVTNGTTYYYQVQALNPGGLSPLSSEVSATPSGSAAQSWTGTVNYSLSGEPVQSCSVTIPDLNRPIQAAMLTSEGPNMLSVANKYNAVILGIDGFTKFNFGTPANPINLTTPDDGHQICIMDYRWPQLGARRVQAALTAVANLFPAHPEIANTGIILYGFSEGTDNTNLTVSPYYDGTALVASPLANRVLAMVQLSELDEDTYNPLSTMDTVPHLFLASGLPDTYSNLGVGLEDISQVTHDALARGIATRQGGPLTVINNAGAGHGGNPDLTFISTWLDSVLSQRLPSTVPTSTTVNLPSWQYSSSWVGTYDLSSSTSSPWGSIGTPGVQLINNLISPQAAYTDSRPYTWLPGQNAANKWLAYANGPNTVTFFQWATGFGISTNPAATPGNDGISNLMKYFCDINPTVPLTPATRAFLPAVGSATIAGIDSIALTYRQQSNITDVAATLETSSDLVNWTPTTAVPVPIGTDPITQDKIMQVSVPAVGGGSQFVRLKLKFNP